MPANVRNAEPSGRFVWGSRAAAFLVAATILGVLSVSASSPEDRQARPLHVLLYHPYPDPAGDPWGFPAAPRDGEGVGYMEATYGAYWYPTAVFDGLRSAEMTIEGATTFTESFDAYEAALLARRNIDAPIRLTLSGQLRDGEVRTEARSDAKQPLGDATLRLRIVLFEDEVLFDGGNGIQTHRFTVRGVAYDEPLRLGENGTAQIEASATLNASWDKDRLGFVASVHHVDGAGFDYAAGEVLQASTFVLGQDGPTVQHSRGVLLEMLTATWCAACLYGDTAVDELANEYGKPSSRFLERSWSYYQPVDAGTLGAAVAVAIVAAVLAAGRLRTTRRSPT